MRLFFHRLLNVHAAVLCYAFYCLVGLQLDQFADDPGVGWHLKTGEYILRNLSIPKEDPFLASPANGGPRSWVSDQWLSDLILYLGFDCGSWALLYALGTSLFLAIFLVVLYRGVRELGGSALASSVACFLSFKMASIHFILRPVMFSFLFFTSLWIYLLKKYRNPDSHMTARAYFGGIGFFLLWSNIHPSFVLGLGLIVLLLLALVIDAFIRGERRHSPSFSNQVTFFFLLCCLATLCNPYGFQLFKSIISLSQSSYFMSLNNEWLSLDFRSKEALILETVLGFILSAIFLSRRKLYSHHSFEWLCCLGFLHSAVSSVRMLPYFSIVIALVTAECMIALGSSYICSEIPFFKKLIGGFSWIERREQSCGNGVLPFCLIATFCIAYALAYQRIPFYQEELGPSKYKYPFEAITTLKSQAGIGPQQPARVLSGPNWGGFITFYSESKLQALIDDRNTMLGEDFYREYFAQMRPSGQWLGYAKRLAATYILLPFNDSLVQTILDSSCCRLIGSRDAALFEILPERESTGLSILSEDLNSRLSIVELHESAVMTTFDRFLPEP